MCSSIGSIEDIAVPEFRPVERGSWAMLAFTDMTMEPPPEGRLFGEVKVSSVHYAFITRSRDGDMIVADLKDFVGRTVGHGADSAVDELVSNVTSASRGGSDGGSDEGGILSIDWSRLKSLDKDEAKDIVECFIPAYEEARELGVSR